MSVFSLKSSLWNLFWKAGDGLVLLNIFSKSKDWQMITFEMFWNFYFNYRIECLFHICFYFDFIIHLVMGDYTVPETGALVLILSFTCNVNLIPIESYCFCRVLWCWSFVYFSKSLKLTIVITVSLSAKLSTLTRLSKYNREKF